MKSISIVKFKNLVFLKNVNRSFRKNCILEINSRTKKRKKFLVEGFFSYNKQKKRNSWKKIYLIILKSLI